MSDKIVRETFFRPERAFARESSAIPAGIYNSLRRLLGHSRGASLFVPIRAMQYLAIVERDEILFVDAQGGYAHRDGIGGRLIRLAWLPATMRTSLSAPVPCEMVYYFSEFEGVQSRLLTEMGPALDYMLEKQRDRNIGAWEGRILPFPHPSAG